MNSFYQKRNHHILYGAKYVVRARITKPSHQFDYCNDFNNKAKVTFSCIDFCDKIKRYNVIENALAFKFMSILLQKFPCILKDQGQLNFIKRSRYSFSRIAFP